MQSRKRWIGGLARGVGRIMRYRAFIRPVRRVARVVRRTIKRSLPYLSPGSRAFNRRQANKRRRLRR